MNQDDSPVKIIFVPSYLYGNDGIFNLSYYDLLIGLDMTVFPSYYEPWGYTPLESIAFHIPTITTNLAGFGLWAETEGGGNLDSGVKVIERNDNNYFEVAEKIKNTIIQYSTEYHPDQMKETKEAAYLLSKKASWSHFIQYYLDAYDIALKNI
jgi:glycogen synthase